nr:reverse transcriptase domain-containing protein [Tanacetum cinerariifolium]
MMNPCVLPTCFRLTLGFAITIPTANEFAIKGNHSTLVKENQFDGRTKIDPHENIHEFLEICDMFKYRDTKNEAVRLMMFPLSLTREANTWLDELNEGTIETWDELRTPFISQFFPPALFDRLFGEIRAFSQHENESLTDAWLRMKEMLRNCHGHNLSKGNIIKIFYQDKVLLKLDWAKNKKTKSSLKKTVAFVDEGNSNSDTDKIMARMDAMTLKMDAQYKELQSHDKQPIPDLEDDGILMSSEQEAKFMQTFRKTRFYNDYGDQDSNRDNWRSSGQNDYNRDNYRSNTNDKSYDLQRQFNDFMKSQQSTNAFVKETFMDLKTQLETVAKNHQALIQNLETKFDRLADKQSGRPSGSLPSKTQPNPRGNNSKAYQPPQSHNEHVNFVFTRSGKSYDQQKNSKNSINFNSDDENEEPTPQPKINLRNESKKRCYQNHTNQKSHILNALEKKNVSPIRKIPRHDPRRPNQLIRVKHKQLNLEVGTKRMIFNIDSAIKHSYSNDDTCFSIDVIDENLEEDFDALLNEGSKILHFIEGTILKEEIFSKFDKFIAMTADETYDSESDTEEPPF